MKFYSASDINNALDYTSLIEALRVGFTKQYIVPPRTHLDYNNPEDENQNTMLLMPAVSCGSVAGVKIVNVALKNSLRDLPSIQGIYYLLNATTGEPLAIFDAKCLTNWRTAAASALASDILASKESNKLLMIGTGALAPFLIDAHSTVRPIKELFIYGRTRKKAEALAESKKDQFDQVTVVDHPKEAIPLVDIISSATFSSEPLIHGEFLTPGQHIDLVGAFKPTSRESDDEVIRRSRLFVDTLEMAPKEAGDIQIPINSGIISMADIQGDLFQLCKEEVLGRTDERDITLFKSVGHALEDLVAAEVIYNNANV